MGTERAAAIENMESMGFPRVDIDRAMRAAYNNPDRAVEYLLTVSSVSFANSAPFSGWAFFEFPISLETLHPPSPQTPQNAFELGELVQLLRCNYAACFGQYFWGPNVLARCYDGS